MHLVRESNSGCRFDPGLLHVPEVDSIVEMTVGVTFIMADFELLDVNCGHG
jgi:hypothetical protein